MATSQQHFVDQFVTLINANANLSARVVASSPSAGVLRLTSRGGDDPYVTFIAAGSSITGVGTFVSKAATGTPPYAELWFSWTLAPGDTVNIEAGTPGVGVILTYNQPLNTVVDPGGFDHTGFNPNGSTGGVITGGTGVGTAQNRRLVVVECGAASTSFGSMFALDPQDATGVAIPTFRVVTSLPAAGGSVGESIYVTATRQGYVWDGVSWRDITASPIRSFTNDTQLQANTTEAIGTYAVASDTGNMYVMTADGWRRLGIVEFSTYADLDAWDAALGTEAISRDLDVVFLRVDNAGGTESWIPISQLVKPEAEITAVQNIAGLTAVASDTGKRFVNNGTRWIQDPIEHYATEALLLAATPIDGHLAWADSTNVVFTAAGGTWHRLQGPQLTYGTTAPTTPGVGDFWYNSSSNRQTLNIWTGTEWKSTSGVTVGGTGARVILPGYFNEDPSNTATADDIGGLAFRYNGGQNQLFLNKGNSWNAMTPMLGVPANAGKVATADANGNMVWRDTVHRERINDDSYAAAEHVLALAYPATKWVEMKGVVQCRDNYTARPYVQFGTNVWDFSNTANNVHPQALCQYAADGIGNANSTYFSDHFAGLTYKNTSSYSAAAGHPLCFTLRATRLGSQYWIFSITSQFRSDNNTPMLFTSSWQSTVDADIVTVGVVTYNFAGNTKLIAAKCIDFEYQ